MLQSKNLWPFFAGGFAFIGIAALSGIFAFAAYQKPSVYGDWSDSTFEMHYKKGGTGSWSDHRTYHKKIQWYIDEQQMLVCEITGPETIFRYRLSVKFTNDSSAIFHVVAVSKASDGSQAFTELPRRGADRVYHMIRVKSHP